MAIATTNPATGRVERTFEEHDAAEVERRLQLAEQASWELRRTSYAQRSAWLHAAAGLLEEEAEQTARILTTEMGKTISQARAEVAKCAKGLRFYADHGAAMLADSPLDDASVVGAERAWTRYEPLGPVLAVMPWNYPLWQVVRFAAPALMAGNAGLLKHASNVPQAALYLDSLFERSGFPSGAFQTLMIGAARVDGVIRDHRVRAVTLTGSEPAGRSVAAAAGAEVKKVVLELGGADPFIVLPSADLDRAAATAVAARVVNNGQSCIAAKRFIVHQDVYDEFVAAFVKQMGGLRVGDPLDEATDVGPIATEAGRRDLVELVADAIEAGATATVGQTVPGDGWYYPPTVLEDVTDRMRVYREETFGPVATVLRATDADHALAIANDTSFGLSSSVWTSDQEEADRFIAGLEAGAVFVNGMTISYPELPFGGIKDSGIGRELAAEGIREFCNLKTVWTAS
ncbi:NADP-dependent succinic semialdehyde dehydrogenase [Nocardioides humi]|uniref:NADP-dependent succinic semialdehyde dehydrogenase n=1 Tax=Nocardioides humi TaxID=449461 RepID=A0ABN2BRJ8_9ACTN|nr:NADP-dependent succinic semialdehyde dehydrogenase [Nocardioides humi]